MKKILFSIFIFSYLIPISGYLNSYIDSTTLKPSMTYPMLMSTLTNYIPNMKLKVLQALLILLTSPKNQNAENLVFISNKNFPKYSNNFILN